MDTLEQTELGGYIAYPNDDDTTWTIVHPDGWIIMDDVENRLDVEDLLLIFTTPPPAISYAEALEIGRVIEGSCVMSDEEAATIFREIPGLPAFGSPKFGTSSPNFKPMTSEEIAAKKEEFARRTEELDSTAERLFGPGKVELP